MVDLVRVSAFVIDLVRVFASMVDLARMVGSRLMWLEHSLFGQ